MKVKVNVLKVPFTFFSSKEMAKLEGQIFLIQRMPGNVHDLATKASIQKDIDKGDFIPPPGALAMFLYLKIILRMNLGTQLFQQVELTLNKGKNGAFQETYLGHILNQ